MAARRGNSRQAYALANLCRLMERCRLCEIPGHIIKQGVVRYRRYEGRHRPPLCSQVTLRKWESMIAGGQERLLTLSCLGIEWFDR